MEKSPKNEKNTFLMEKSPKNQKNTFLMEKSPKNQKNAFIMDISQKNRNLLEKSQKSTYFNDYVPSQPQKIIENTPKNKRNVEKSPESSWFIEQNPKKNLGFQPVLPDNIESDVNYLMPESMKMKDSRKDFSVFGKFITSNTNENNAISKSIEEKSLLKKSRSSKFSYYDHEYEEDPDSKKRTASHKNHENTFHNASISVLSHIDFTLKSFASNKPELGGNSNIYRNNNNYGSNNNNNSNYNANVNANSKINGYNSNNFNYSNNYANVYI